MSVMASPLKSPVIGVPLPKESDDTVPVWKLVPFEVANCQLPPLKMAISVRPSAFQSPKSGMEALVPNPESQVPGGGSVHTVAQEMVQLPVAGLNLMRSVFPSPLASPANWGTPKGICAGFMTSTWFLSPPDSVIGPQPLCW